MKLIHLPTSLLLPLLAAAVLPLGGCSGGVTWGEEAGGGGAAMANGAATASGETLRTGSISTPLIQGTVTVIAERQATARQMSIAMQRGRTWSAHAGATAGAPHHHHRYIAVDTAGDSRTAPQARRSVIIFDTQAQQVVGGNVYDVQSTPPVGTVARFDIYSAQYIGAGL